MRPRVAVVVAAVDARATLAPCLDRFRAEIGDRGELVVVASAPDRHAVQDGGQARILRRPAGRLAPELWRDGLLATDAPLVAFTTAAMAPRAGWLAASIGALEAAGAAGVGGPIAPGPDLSATGRAVYLHRYARSMPPLPVGVAFDPPGDNALYRRERLMAVGPSWAGGFWEVEVHRRLRARGDRLAMAPAAVVEYLGGDRLATGLRRRFDHARHYASARMRGRSPFARLARAAAWPTVPAVLSARIAAGLRRRGEPLGPWMSALPSLAVLLNTWALGEAAGCLLGRPRARAQGQATPTGTGGSRWPPSQA